MKSCFALLVCLTIGCGSVVHRPIPTLTNCIDGDCHAKVLAVHIWHSGYSIILVGLTDRHVETNERIEIKNYDYQIRDNGAPLLVVGDIVSVSAVRENNRITYKVKERVN